MLANMDLFGQLQSSMAGSQAGDQVMNQGMMPNTAQPRGSQQLWMAGIAAIRHEIQQLNKLADSLRRVGLEKEDREVTGCVHKLQGTLDSLQSKMADMQQQSM